MVDVTHIVTYLVKSCKQDSLHGYIILFIVSMFQIRANEGQQTESLCTDVS
jgi:hypothetical protein